MNAAEKTVLLFKRKIVLKIRSETKEDHLFDTADRLCSKAFQCEDVGVLLRILNNAAAESISEALRVKNSE